MRISDVKKKKSLYANDRLRIARRNITFDSIRNIINHKAVNILYNQGQNIILQIIILQTITKGAKKCAIIVFSQLSMKRKNIWIR